MWTFNQVDPNHTIEVEPGKYEVIVTARYANIDDISQYPELIIDRDIAGLYEPGADLDLDRERGEWIENYDQFPENLKPIVWNFTFIPTDAEIEHQILKTRPALRL
ncbi:MAG: hypothetical protein ACFBSG_21010 [Leptolyngbyaceae cyanobacterium]